jgi:hypothetical protein
MSNGCIAGCDFVGVSVGAGVTNASAVLGVGGGFILFA